jgi:hypothetical protein
MIKIIEVKYASPKEALESIQSAGIFNYMINWGCNIDQKNKRLIFTLRHGGGTGGSFDKELKEAIQQLESFIKSIDTPKK